MLPCASEGPSGHGQSDLNCPRPLAAQKVVLSEAVAHRWFRKPPGTGLNHKVAANKTAAGAWASTLHTTTLVLPAANTEPSLRVPKTADAPRPPLWVGDN